MVIGYLADFVKHPEAFYTLASELFPGKFNPTLTHHFLRLLELKGILTRCFTQNIDTLERLAHVSEELIIEAHGSCCSLVDLCFELEMHQRDPA